MYIHVAPISWPVMIDVLVPSKLQFFHFSCGVDTGPADGDGGGLMPNTFLLNDVSALANPSEPYT